jgi:hypothetical protein
MSCPVDWERPSETPKEWKKPSFSVTKISRSGVVAEAEAEAEERARRTHVRRDGTIPLLLVTAMRRTGPFGKVLPCSGRIEAPRDRFAPPRNDSGNPEALAHFFHDRRPPLRLSNRPREAGLGTKRSRPRIGGGTVRTEAAGGHFRGMRISVRHLSGGVVWGSSR